MNDFKSLQELYDRVKPALRTKSNDLKRLNNYNIDLDQIWIFLKNNKWSKSEGLTLSDMVNDIMKLSYEDLIEEGYSD